MDDEIAEVVREYGWYAASVSDNVPPFLYSIGLMKSYQHPEMIVFGLDPQNAYALLSGLIGEARAGRRFSGHGVCNINIGGDEHRVGIRIVHSTQHPLFLGFAMGFARNLGQSLEAVQVFWPDRNGKFPFDVGCEIEVYNLQPRLDISLTPREVRQFERQWE
jgi:hypothetical protein